MNDTPRSHHVKHTYVHFADGGASKAIAVTPSFWPDLASGKLRELDAGRLMTHGEFSGDWDSWEMHPRGEELVLILSGSATLVLEGQGKTQELALNTPGAFVIIPRGTWHTIRAAKQCSMLFVTPGQGTEHRSRSL